MLALIEQRGGKKEKVQIKQAERGVGKVDRKRPLRFQCIMYVTHMELTHQLLMLGTREE